MADTEGDRVVHMLIVDRETGHEQIARRIRDEWVGIDGLVQKRLAVEEQNEEVRKVASVWAEGGENEVLTLAGRTILQLLDGGDSKCQR